MKLLVGLILSDISPDIIQKFHFLSNGSEVSGLAVRNLLPKPEWLDEVAFSAIRFWGCLNYLAAVLERMTVDLS